MSNIVAFLTSAVTAPMVFTREQVKQEIANIKADAIHTLGSVSTVAARESFIKTCTAIAVQRAVFGQDEIYRTICEKARRLSDYKTNKHGVVVGALGKFLTGLADAVAVGKVLADKFSASENDVDLSVFFDSPTFAALIAAPKKAVPPTKEEIASAEKLAKERAAIALAVQQEKEKAAAQKALEQAAAQKALEQAAAQAAQEKAANEASGPYFVALFDKVRDSNPEQALSMLTAMASHMGFDLAPVKAKKAVKIPA